MSIHAESDRRATSLTAADPFGYLRRFDFILEPFEIDTHFLRPTEGIIGNRVVIEGRELISYSSYNYLGYSGDARVQAAAKSAIERYGTSVSASRLLAGEKPLHRELERQIASLIGAEDCLAFVSGHATNVTTIGCLFGPKDLILYDVLSHNSIQQGIRLSGAQCFPFPHNNVRAVDSLLAAHRAQRQRALVVTEGVFSMDGDIAPIPEFIDVKQRHRASLMIDEAHSMGVIGRSGRGIVEHFELDPASVDLWMGTLSKSFASCGGYVAGRRALVESLRYAAPGFAYSCGLTPANAAAALEAARCLEREPQRVARLIENADRFRALAARAGIDTGLSDGAAVVPAILGSSILSVVVAGLLFKRGILVHPLFYPVVPERSSRLRFFLTTLHSEDEIARTVDSLVEAAAEARALFESMPPGLAEQVLRAAAASDSSLEADE